MQWKIIVALAVGFGVVVAGISGNDVIFTNRTGLPIARILIGDRTLQGDVGGNVHDKILVAVTPHKHHLLIIFRGGAGVDFPHFQFKGVHEIIFVRHENKIEAHVQ